MRIIPWSSVLILGVALVVPAQAQLSLPGATAPTPMGSVVKPEVRASKPRPKTVPPTAPAEGNLAGKTLHLNGGKSEISFAARDKTVDLSRLLLAGTKLSQTHDECQVDVSGMPLPLTPAGKTDGLARFTLPVPACPLSFEVLQGAILVTGDTPTCTFTEADCAVAPAGLWGPAPGDIGPDQVKTIERERTQAERGVRAAYQGLTHATRDKAAIRGFASDQAGFSSKREEFCRDYIGEARHGFCAARLAEARATALETELAGVKVDNPVRKKGPGLR